MSQKFIKSQNKNHDSQAYGKYFARQSMTVYCLPFTVYRLLFTVPLTANR